MFSLMIRPLSNISFSVFLFVSFFYDIRDLRTYRPTHVLKQRTTLANNYFVFYPFREGSSYRVTSATLASVYIRLFGWQAKRMIRFLRV